MRSGGLYIRDKETGEVRRRAPGERPRSARSPAGRAPAAGAAGEVRPAGGAEAVAAPPAAPPKGRAK